MAKTLVKLAEHLSPGLLKAFKPKGVYVMDEEECATRRVDLNAPLDEDPGPLPMPPVEEGEDAIVLSFSDPSDEV